MKSVALLLVLVGLALAKKGGKAEVDPEIVNPDISQAGVHTKEFNEDMFQGDIVPKGGNGEDRNAIGDKTQLWASGVVPYVLDSTLSSNMRRIVENSMADYHQNTCVRWVQRNGEYDYVNINAAYSGCYAYVGRSGGKQPLNLEDPGCDQKGAVIHEMLHTIGFDHEQSRNDRDRYVTINWNNINPKMHNQFEKMPSEDAQGFGYDYHSVMHYPDWGFAIGSSKAITTKDPSMQKVIGQRMGFSKQDIKEVNKLYNCNGNGGSVGGGSTGGGSGCQDEFTLSKCQMYLKQFGQSACRASSGDFGKVCAKTCGNC